MCNIVLCLCLVVSCRYCGGCYVLLYVLLSYSYVQLCEFVSLLGVMNGVMCNIVICICLVLSCHIVTAVVVMSCRV